MVVGNEQADSGFDGHGLARAKAVNMDRGTCKLLLWAAELGIGKVVPPISPRSRRGPSRGITRLRSLSQVWMPCRGAGLNIMYRNCLAHLSPKCRNYAR